VTILNILVMKTILSFKEMSEYTGGRSKFWDGFCVGVGIIDTGWALGIIALVPVGGVLVIGASAGCIIREIALQNE
jgi:hypothetical protein